MLKRRASVLTIFGVIFMCQCNLFAQSNSSFKKYCETREDAKCVYYLLNDKTNNIKINDTIGFIKQALKLYANVYYKNDYLKKHFASDQIFNKYINTENFYGNYSNRYNKRMDFEILFFIHFELFLKHRINKEKYISTVYLRPKKKLKAQYSYYWPYISSSNLTSKENYPNFEIGNVRLMNDQKFYSIYKHKKDSEEKKQNKQMRQIFKYYKKWINEVEKLGSLESARKKGLSPLKNSPYKWAIEYFSVDSSNKLDTFTEFTN